MVDTAPVSLIVSGTDQTYGNLTAVTGTVATVAVGGSFNVQGNIQVNGKVLSNNVPMPKTGTSIAYALIFG